MGGPYEQHARMRNRREVIGNPYQYKRNCCYQQVLIYDKRKIPKVSEINDNYFLIRYAQTKINLFITCNSGIGWAKKNNEVRLWL